MTVEKLMKYVGKTMFAIVSWKYRNDTQRYLEILKYDRLSADNTGYNPFEYGLIVRNKTEENNWYDNVSDFEPLNLNKEPSK